MINHNISPFLWQITDTFGIRWYSLAYILGFFFLYFYLKKCIERNEIKNLNIERLDAFIILLAVSMVIGARIFHVFVFEWDFYSQNLNLILQVWRGGLSFHGAFIFMVIATILFTRYYKIKFYQLADRVVIPAAISLFLGRIANFINGELYGTLWNGPFCINYEGNTHMVNPPEGCRHPTQIYESFKNLFIFGVLLYYKKSEKLKDGMLFWMFIALYGIIRFFLMFIREESVVFISLTTSQILSLSMFIVGVVMIFVVGKHIKIKF